jgi:SprT-like family
MVKTAIKDQLFLFANYTETSLGQFLEDRIGRPVSLVCTGNSTTMLSVRKRDGVLRVRLHWIFLNAESEVLDEIVSFLKGNRREMPRFRKFVCDNRGYIQTKPPKKTSLKTDGRFHDLRGLFDTVNKEYFGGMINAAITWGLQNPRWSVRKRTLGSFSERSNTIRINPILDRKSVPRYYISFVVYHEMLHAAIGISRWGGRRSVHSREFRQREKLFKDYERAIAWESR